MAISALFLKIQFFKLMNILTLCFLEMYDGIYSAFVRSLCIFVVYLTISYIPQNQSKSIPGLNANGGYL